MESPIRCLADNPQHDRQHGKKQKAAEQPGQEDDP
jgi:hypothetical protein